MTFLPSSWIMVLQICFINPYLLQNKIFMQYIIEAWASALHFSNAMKSINMICTINACHQHGHSIWSNLMCDLRQLFASWHLLLWEPNALCFPFEERRDTDVEQLLVLFSISTYFKFKFYDLTREIVYTYAILFTKSVCWPSFWFQQMSWNRDT